MKNASNFLFKCTAAVAFAALLAPASAAVIASGSLSTANGGIVTDAGDGGNQSWNGDTITLDWSVSLAASTYTYSYTFTGSADPGPFSPGLSHLIVETSSTFDMDNVLAGTTTDGFTAPTLYLVGGNGKSNPGLPDDIYGIKWNTDGSVTITLVTDRDPIWGNFYAKGGSGAFAYNSGWDLLLNNVADDADNLYGQSIRLSQQGFPWFLAVPDTTSDPWTGVPEPGVVALFGLGLLGLAIGRRRRA